MPGRAGAYQGTTAAAGTGSENGFLARALRVAPRWRHWRPAGRWRDQRPAGRWWDRRLAGRNRPRSLASPDGDTLAALASMARRGLRFGGRVRRRRCGLVGTRLPTHRGSHRQGRESLGASEEGSTGGRAAARAFAAAEARTD